MVEDNDVQQTRCLNGYTSNVLTLFLLHGEVLRRYKFSILLKTLNLKY